MRCASCGKDIYKVMSGGRTGDGYYCHYDGSRHCYFTSNGIVIVPIPTDSKDDNWINLWMKRSVNTNIKQF